MKRSTAFALIVAGGLAVGSAVYDYATRFSPSKMWKRQTALIERKYKKPATRKLAYDTLRKKLKTLESASNEERCRYEEKNTAMMILGDREKAEEHIARKNYEPYADCKASAQLTDAFKWWNVAGALAFVAGVVGMAASLFRRRERDIIPPEDGVPPDYPI